MKCPKCGREIGGSESRCPFCGADLPREKAGGPENGAGPINSYAVPEPREPGSPSSADSAGADSAGADSTVRTEKSGGARVKTAVKAVFAVLLYLLLYFSIQSCVISNYMFSAADTGEIIAAAQSGDQETAQKAYEHFLEEGVGLVAENEAMLLLLSNLIAIVAVCLLLRLRRKVPSDEIDFHGVNPLRLLQFALFGAAMNVVLTVLLGVLPIPESVQQMQELQYAGLFEGSLAWSLLSVGIVGPAAEEVFFRGLALTRLRPALGNAAAIAVSALLFGLAHGTPMAIGYAFVVGLVLALIYSRYRSILPCIVCHCAFNLTSFWLDGMEGNSGIIVLAAVSAAALILIWRSAVSRYPSFPDVFHDLAGCIQPEDPEKRAIAEECRRIRNSAGPEDFDRIGELAERWEEIDRGKRGPAFPATPELTDERDFSGSRKKPDRADDPGGENDTEKTHSPDEPEKPENPETPEKPDGHDAPDDRK